MDVDKLLQSKRAEILKVAAKHGAFNVRVFGSVARGEADTGSDIDLLVDYSIDQVSSWFPAGLVIELEALLGCKVDVATEPALKERIRAEILREAILL